MAVTTTESEHVYSCDLCGSTSSDLYALDLHRMTLEGPDGPNISKRDADGLFDICYRCRDQIRSSHIEARALLEPEARNKKE